VIPNLKRVLLLAVVTPLGSCMTMLGSPEPVVPTGTTLVCRSRSRADPFDASVRRRLEDVLAIRRHTGGRHRDSRSKSDQAVTYTVDQRYVIVPGVYGALSVVVGRESATVVNQAMPSIAAPERLRRRRPPTNEVPMMRGVSL